MTTIQNISYSHIIYNESQLDDNYTEYKLFSHHLYKHQDIIRYIQGMFAQLIDMIFALLST